MNFELNIKGKVQGVGYRYFVLKIANDLNITGYVRNMPDGSVFVSAFGDETDLNTLIDHLKMGPARARVDQIIINRFESSTFLNHFIIK